MKKIFFLLPRRDYTPIGGFKIVYEYANRLSEKGYNVTLVYPFNHKFYGFNGPRLRHFLSTIKHFFEFAFLCILTKNVKAGEWFCINKEVSQKFVFQFNRKLYEENSTYVATSLITAYALNSLNFNSNKYYLIQDFEVWNCKEDDVFKSYNFPLKKIVISDGLLSKVKSQNQEAILIYNGFDFNTFDIDEKEGIRLAKMTRGYAFAYQVLGYWYFEKNVNKNDSVKDVEVEYRSELIKYSYNKLWSELSEKDKLIVTALVELNADEKPVKRVDAIEYLKSSGNEITSSIFNKYRERLLGKGIISTSTNREGMIWLPLPQFGNFIRLYHID